MRKTKNITRAETAVGQEPQLPQPEYVLVDKDDNEIKLNPFEVETAGAELNGFDFVTKRSGAKAVILENVDSLAVKTAKSPQDTNIIYAYIGTDTTKIGDNCFRDCDALTDIDAPGVLSIGMSSFYDCNALTSINMPSVTTVGNNAFTNTLIENLDLPLVTKLAYNSFSNLQNLKTVSLDSITEFDSNFTERIFSASNYGTTYRISFENDIINDFWKNDYKSEPNGYLLGNRTSLLNNVNITENYRFGPFARCTKLTNISLPNILTVNSGVFRDCYSLTSIYMPKVQNIGDFAFGREYRYIGVESTSNYSDGTWSNYSFINYDSISPYEVKNHYFVPIKSFDLPELKSVGCRSFEFLLNLKSFKASQLTDIGDESFLHCDNLSNICFPNIKNIGERAFFGCDSLLSVSSEKTVNSIAGSSFGHCQKLSAVNMPKLIKIKDVNENILLKFYDGEFRYDLSTSRHCYLALSAFIEFNNNYNSSGSHVNILNVYYGAFADCPHLSVVNLNDTEYIGSYAFQHCTGLKEIEFPNALTINDYALKDCTALTGIALPVTTSLGKGVFLDDTALTNVTANALTTIGESTFVRCTSLTNVSLHKVTEIQLSAFAGCTSLTSLNISSATDVNAHAFDGCVSMTTASLENTPFDPVVQNEPTKTVNMSLGDYAFANCTSPELTSIYIPLNIKNIPTGLFAGSTHLQTIYYGKFEETQAIYTWDDKLALPTVQADAFNGIAENWVMYVPAVLREEFLDDHNWQEVLGSRQNVEKHILANVEPPKQDLTIKKVASRSYIISKGDRPITINNAKPKTPDTKIKVTIAKVDGREDLK